MKRKKNTTNEPKQWNNIFQAFQFYRHLFADRGLKIRLQIIIIYELIPFQGNETVVLIKLLAGNLTGEEFFKPV